MKFRKYMDDKIIIYVDGLTPYEILYEPKNSNEKFREVYAHKNINPEDVLSEPPIELCRGLIKYIFEKKRIYILDTLLGVLK